MGEHQGSGKQPVGWHMSGSEKPGRTPEAEHLLRQFTDLDGPKGVTDKYRDGWDRIFGGKGISTLAYCGICGTVIGPSDMCCDACILKFVGCPECEAAPCKCNFYVTCDPMDNPAGFEGQVACDCNPSCDDCAGCFSPRCACPDCDCTECKYQ